jgi:hypothetical protein
MRRVSIGIAIALTALAIAGCATSSTVKLASSSKSRFDGTIFKVQTDRLREPTPGADVYRVFVFAAYTPLDMLRSDAEKQAYAFCNRKGLIADTVTATSSAPPHILGNIPRVELLFECAVGNRDFLRRVVVDSFIGRPGESRRSDPS